MTAHPPEAFEVRQERDDVRARGPMQVGILSVGIGAAGVFVAGAIQVATLGGLRLREDRPPRPSARTLSNVEQTPVGVTAVGIDLQHRQWAELQSLRWVDRDAGLAAIPIDRAIDLVVERSR